MAYTNKKLIAQNLKKQMHEYRALYENIAENSRQQVLAALPAGSSMVPATGVIYGDDYKHRFTERGNALKQKALDELSEWRKQVSATKTAAPSDEAVRAVQIFQQRNSKSMTREQYQAEAQELADAYGDNYLTYCAIRDIAREGGAHVNPHPLVADIEAFDAVERNVRSFFNPAESLSRGCPSSGKEALTGMVVDELMGTEDDGTEPVSQMNEFFTYEERAYEEMKRNPVGTMSESRPRRSFPYSG